MATYQSSQTSNFAASTSVTITKPTSLAVGDLLVAHLVAGGVSVVSFTVPAGWTEDINTVTAGGTGNDCRLQVLTKVAEAADVSASNFTFTISAADRTGGGLSRVTNYGKKSGSTSATQNDSTTSPIVFAGITPDRADCLFMVFIGMVGTGSGSTPSLTSVAIATSNPTWTERYDLNATGLGDQGIAMATASRPEATATGDVTVTAVLPSAADTAIAVLALGPVLSATSTPAPLTFGTRVNNVLSPEKATFGVNTPTQTTEIPTIWTPINKS